MTAPASLRFAPRPRSGVALVIALALIVLVAGSVVTFLSTVTLRRHVSNQSATQAAVDTLAKGALAVTLADLLQEIADGSTTTNVSGGGVASTVYLPRSAATLVPARVGSDDALPNLVKRSAAGQPFYSSASYASSGIARAAASPTTAPSLNSRSLSLARWNKALLLPKRSPGQSSDLAPVSAFVAPDWVCVARDGSNPVAASTNVIGRYAYAIYDEGGLLDANAAGYPSALPAAFAGRKLGAPTADLTVLGLSASDVDALVGWRRYASARPAGSFPGYAFNADSATNYYNAAASDRSGFLLVGNALWNGQSDRLFGSRQQLIQFLLQGVAVGSGRRAALQNSLQYLGTFSRDVAQPSFFPSAQRPRIVGPWKAGADNTAYPLTSGGNNAYGLDDQVNPAFLAVRATSAFTRNDGGAAVHVALISDPAASGGATTAAGCVPSAIGYLAEPSPPF
ncbi:MAG TPA: hypothetical protein VIM58_03595, partial [Candidatus Methylacidiphilales bacterium]